MPYMTLLPALAAGCSSPRQEKQYRGTEKKFVSCEGIFFLWGVLHKDEFKSEQGWLCINKTVGRWQETPCLCRRKGTTLASNFEKETPSLVGNTILVRCRMSMLDITGLSGNVAALHT